MASDMGSRMESVSRDLNRQLAQFAAFEFRRVMSLDKKERAAAMAALEARLKTQMGDYASFLKSLQFTPAAVPRFLPPPSPRPQSPGNSSALPMDRPGGFRIDFPGAAGTAANGISGNDKKLLLPPFPMGQFNAEVRSGKELVGKVSAEISSHRLLFHVLMRTQPRQGEIPFAMDADGKLYEGQWNNGKPDGRGTPAPALV